MLYIDCAMAFSETNILELRKKAAILRLEVLRALTKADSGHTGSAMSVMEILTTLYYAPLYSGKSRGGYGKGKEEDKDYIILSKGHACPAQYVMLADLGYFDKEELGHLRQCGAMLQGHPCVKTPGICVATGSLGQGFSAAHGVALSLKLDKKPNKVFAILGDGELQEGIVWETAMSAAHFKSDNLIAIIDNNGLQIDGPNKAVMNVDPIQDKFEAFGWKVIQVMDGHDFKELFYAVDKAMRVIRQPTCIWCHTVKGKGVPFAENKVNYHGVALSPEELCIAEGVIGKEC